MKLARKIVIGVSIFTNITVLSYIFFTKSYYEHLVGTSGSWAPSVYRASVSPYYLLIANVIMIIIYCIVEKVKTKKLKLSVLYFTTIILFVLTQVFTTPFQFVSTQRQRGTFRYDKMFVYNLFWDNEGDYEGKTGISKYVYLPFSKKIVYFREDGVVVKPVTYLGKDKIKIGSEKYTIESTWFSWS